jgi:hypothetical protein
VPVGAELKDNVVVLQVILLPDTVREALEGTGVVSLGTLTTNACEQLAVLVMVTV